MPFPAQSTRPWFASLALRWGALLPAAVAGTLAAVAAPGVIIESFSAGGHEQTLRMQGADTDTDRDRKAAGGFVQSYEPVRLPVTAQALDFRIAPNPASDDEPARIQYQLVGWDEDWREVEGVMWLSIRFLDDKARRISSESLPRSGQSSGWTGNPNTSPFRTHHETITPPPRSRQLQIFLAACGPRTMGTWLVKSFRVIAVPGGNQPERVLATMRIERGDELHEPRGVPVDWRREGTNSSICQVFTLKNAESRASEHALALIDNDVRSTGRWVAMGQNLVPVEPGIALRIETEEAFSIGAGGNYTCSYHKLPTGRYRFRAIPVDEFGVQSGSGVELPVILVPPFYASWWFWTIVGVVTITGVAGGVRYATRKRMQHQLEQLESRRAIEAERIRIAQDIHDDMGARLTQISLASGLALRNTPPDSAAIGDLKRLDRAARDVAIALDEIVWAVNPAHDTLEGLGNYISQYVTEITAESSLRCRLEIPALLPPRFVSSGVRHHLLMALKEALNNALKHSQASEVRVQLTYEDPTLTLTVSDNGCGFDASLSSVGNGIANMRRRLQAAGGACEIRSAADRGVQVTFRLKLDADGTARDQPRKSDPKTHLSKQ
jgi:signal transduction histidine kinase